MERFYFTFGAAHEHRNGYLLIKAPDWESARQEMFRRFDRDWGFQYDESDWIRDGVSQAEKYGLEEIARVVVGAAS